MPQYLRAVRLLFLLSLVFAACREDRSLSDLGAAELRDAGMAKLDAGDEKEARDLFELMMTRSSAAAAEGMYLVGMSYYRQGLYDDAFVRFNQLIDRYPASEWCDDAQYMKGQARLNAAAPLEKDQSLVEEALDEFTTLIEEYEDSELVPKAQEGIAEGRRRKAAKVLAVGKFYKKTGKYRAATVYFENLAADYPEFDGLAEATFLAGACYEELGDTESAASSYRAVLARFPESSFAAPAAARLDALRP